MAAKILINDFLLNEFVFDVISNSDTKDKARLSERQIRAIKTAKTTKHFVSKSTIDEKLILLSKLGCSYALMVNRVKHLYPAQMKKLYKKHKGELTEETITDILSSGLFIVTDRQVSMFFNLMGNGCHSDNYMLNRDFYRIGKNISKFRDAPNPTSENLREGLEHADLIVKMLLNSAMSSKEMKGLTEIGDLDFNILLYLFRNKKEYVSRESINQYFRVHYKATIIGAAVKRLALSAHIENAPIGYAYMITSLGINTVFSYMRKVMTDTLEY